MPNKKLPNVAVVGVAGAVGQEFVRILEQRKRFRLRSIKFFGHTTVGKLQPFRGEKYRIEHLDSEDFKGIDIVLASAGSSVSRQFVPRAVKNGAVVVDNSLINDS